ncbi:MAG: response regulator transcription factor [Ignavibacteriaceae bacterium]|nr:response regulator transcription factor [Ignavibacteriaceae bacterium]
MGSIRILICDDHSYIRDGFIKRLEFHPGMFIVGEAANGNEMITQYENLKPDLIISDIEMPPLSGIDALKQLKLKYPEIKVLFVSVYQGEDTIFTIIKAGGQGLLSKGSDKGELLYAINEVMNDRQYFGPEYTNEKLAAIIDKFSTPPKKFIIDPRKARNYLLCE